MLILPHVQPEVKDSVSKFMAYVHVSVNKASKDYLSNERRYNYTTPKSFLEQIKLYGNLLALKRRDLTSKMERLENGLEKLNSTTAQVISVRSSWLTNPPDDDITVSPEQLYIYKSTKSFFEKRYHLRASPKNANPRKPHMRITRPVQRCAREDMCVRRRVSLV